MKTIILSVSVILCAIFASCSTSFEKAYEAESNYRLAKNGVIYEKSDTTKFQVKFEREYGCMSPEEKKQYGQYRMARKAEEKRAYLDMKNEQKKISAMLND